MYTSGRIKYKIQYNGPFKTLIVALKDVRVSFSFSCQLVLIVGTKWNFPEFLGVLDLQETFFSSYLAPAASYITATTLQFQYRIEWERFESKLW